jgi:sodium/bile acid cotransporter 7
MSVHPNGALPNGAGPSSKPPAKGPWRVWAKKNFLPLALVSALTLGLLFPAFASGLDKLTVGGYRAVSTGAILWIFFMQGLNLKLDDVAAALKAWRGMLCGLAFILCVTPPCSFLVKPLRFMDPDLRAGLTLFMCVPSTINAGVALVGVAQGNVPMALLMTVTANVIGVFTVPFYLSIFLGTEEAVDLDPVAMISELGVTILTPAAIGMFLRRKPLVEELVKVNKDLMGKTTIIATASLPFLKVGSSHAKITSLSAPSMLGVVAASVTLHSLLLVAAFAVTHPFPKLFPPAVRKAVVILGSEKTAPVAFAVIAFLPADLGDKGIIGIPCIIGQLCQILMDSVVATKWLEHEERTTRPLGSPQRSPYLGPMAAPPLDDDLLSESMESNFSRRAMSMVSFSDLFMDTCIAADVFVQHKENFGTELAFASPCSQAWAKALAPPGTRYSPPPLPMLREETVNEPATPIKRSSSFQRGSKFSGPQRSTPLSSDRFASSCATTAGSACGENKPPSPPNAQRSLEP